MSCGLFYKRYLDPFAQELHRDGPCIQVKGHQGSDGGVCGGRGCVRGGAVSATTDTASGAPSVRPGLDQALDELNEGDTLAVWRLDRLGRSLPHLVATIDNLTRRGVNLKSLHEAIDTSAPLAHLR